MKRASKEYCAIFLFVVMFIVLLIPAILHARREKRDSIRRNDLAQIKYGLEMYFNQHNEFPRGDGGCIKSTGSNFLWGENSVLVKESHLKEMPHDPRENEQSLYEFCITKEDSNEDGKISVQEFELRARLENKPKEKSGFDHNARVYWKTTKQDGVLLYIVCGGEGNTCGADPED